jgi:PAS domain S-box-containing protein
VTEQNRANSLFLSESQMKKKNLAMLDEIDTVTKKFADLSSSSQQQIDSLTEQLSLLTGDQKEIRAKFEAMTQQVAQEKSSRTSVEQELARMKEQSGSTTAELHSTIEDRTAELQRIQQMLHNESIEHKQVEEILSTKEQSFRRTIAELQSSVSSLEHDVASLTDQVRNETSARQTVERVKQQSETEFRTTIGHLESNLLLLQTEFQHVSDQLQEETTTRLASEKTLQESKEKLYGVIHEQEEVLTEKNILIDDLKQKILTAEFRIHNLEKTVFNIINLTPLPVFIVNEQGMCEIFNETMNTTIGFAPTDLMGKHFSRLFPESERAFYEEQWITSTNKEEEFRGETNILTSTGESVSAEISFVEIHTGTERKFVGIIFDKTNEIAAEQFYAEARKLEEELRQLKSRFIFMVSNQLRTALVTVATNTELLERFMFKWNDEKRYRAFFRINESLKQMMDMLRNIETTTSAQTETYTQKISPVNLETLIQSAAKDAMEDTGSDIHFVLSEQGEVSGILLDAKAVTTIAYHLLSNAFKYSRDGGTVTVHIERIDEKCLITVSDSGIGIPAEEQKYLFSSFFRASNAGNVHGSGLGLTIVRQFVQMIGGTVSITSAVNKGTSVLVSLPVASM